MNRSRIFNSIANACRNLVNPLFIAVMSYLFIHKGFPQELQSINRISALVNLFLVFSGWGIKDYLIKESAGPFDTFKANWKLAFYSKLLLILPLTVISWFLLPFHYAGFVILVAVLRTYNSMYEPLIIFYKRNLLFLLIDFSSALFLILFIFSGVIRTDAFFFFGIAFFELVKALINKAIFKWPFKPAVNYRKLFDFLKDTRFYFFLVLLSFFQSRIDLYLLGFLFSPDKLNEYQLLSSLISLSQVVIASFVVSYSKLLYRNIGLAEVSFRRLVFRAGALVSIVSAGLIYMILNFIYRFEFNIVNTIVAAFNILAFSWTLYEMYYYTRQKWLDKTLLFLFISGLLNFLLCMALIPSLGVGGALSGNTLAMFSLGLLMAARRVRKKESGPAL